MLNVSALSWQILFFFAEDRFAHKVDRQASELPAWIRRGGRN
jgi:hypothetical protein